MKRKNIFPAFLTFLILSILFLSISNSSPVKKTGGLFEIVFSGFGRTMIGITGIFHKESTSLSQKLEKENKVLVGKFVNFKKLEEDNRALRDQFQTTNSDILLSSQDLLVASVVGAPSFIPQITKPENFILDKGRRDNVKVGQGVIYQNNVVGKVVKVSENRSVVNLATSVDFSISAKTFPMTSGKVSFGVIKGIGEGEMTLDNVLLSEELSKEDIVVTFGDLDSDGIGFPPNLIIGKITSIQKKPSALFQTANVKSLLDFSYLPIVFIIIPK